jgi:hypothetical protein
MVGSQAKGLALGGLLKLVYFLVGVLQFAAIMSAAHVWWGLGTIWSIVVAAILAYIPFVGTVAGILGAHTGWGWGWPASLLLFLWPYVLVLALALVGSSPRSRT